MTSDPWHLRRVEAVRDLGDEIWRKVAEIVREHEADVENVVHAALYQGRVVTHIERWPHATIVRSWDEEIGAVPKWRGAMTGDVEGMSGGLEGGDV
jgi:hypothetical protein